MATFNLYNHVAEIIGDGTLDMDNATANTFAAVFIKEDYVALAGHTTFNDVTVANVVANAAANAIPLPAHFWNRSTNTVNFGGDALVWTADGGAMAGDQVVVYMQSGGGTIETPPNTSNLLIGWSNIGAQSISDTGTLTVKDSTNASQVVLFSHKVV